MSINAARVARVSRASAVALLATAALSLLATCGPSRSDAGITLLVSESFSASALPAGWKVDQPGVWSIEDGRLRGALPDRKQLRSFVRIGSKEWTNYAVELDVCQVRGVDKGVVVRAGDDGGVGTDLRGGAHGDIVMYRNYTQLGRATAPNRAGRWNHLRVEANRGRYRVYVDGQLKIDYLDKNNVLPSGGIALTAYTGGAGACEVLYDNLVVRPLP